MEADGVGRKPALFHAQRGRRNGDAGDAGVGDAGVNQRRGGHRAIAADRVCDGGGLVDAVAVFAHLQPHGLPGAPSHLVKEQLAGGERQIRVVAARGDRHFVVRAGVGVQAQYIMRVHAFGEREGVKRFAVIARAQCGGQNPHPGGVVVDDGDGGFLNGVVELRGAAGQPVQPQGKTLARLSRAIVGDVDAVAGAMVAAVEIERDSAIAVVRGVAGGARSMVDHQSERCAVGGDEVNHRLAGRGLGECHAGFLPPPGMLRHHIAAMLKADRGVVAHRHRHITAGAGRITGATERVADGGDVGDGVAVLSRAHADHLRLIPVVGGEHQLAAGTADTVNGDRHIRVVALRRNPHFTARLARQFDAVFAAAVFFQRQRLARELEESIVIENGDRDLDADPFVVGCAGDRVGGGQGDDAAFVLAVVVFEDGEADGARHIPRRGRAVGQKHDGGAADIAALADKPHIAEAVDVGVGNRMPDRHIDIWAGEQSHVVGEHAAFAHGDCRRGDENALGRREQCHALQQHIGVAVFAVGV